jgi:TctA family transporter
MRQLIIDVWLSEFAIGVYVGLVPGAGFTVWAFLSHLRHRPLTRR